MQRSIVATMLVVLAGSLFATAPTVPPAGQDAQWGPDFRLTVNTYSDENYWSSQRRIVKDAAGIIHVVWHATNPTLGIYQFQVYYKRHNPGSGWTQDTMISGDIYDDSANARYPSMALDSAGRVYVVWVSGSNSSANATVHIKGCTPSGSGNGGWDSLSTQMSVSSLPVTKECPSIACTPNGNLHVVWREVIPSAGQFIAYRQRDMGMWQAVVPLDSNDYYKVYPSVAASRDNNVHVCWHGYGTGSTSYYQIWYKTRTAGAWQPTENVSSGTRNQMYPSIAVDPSLNFAHVLWQGYDSSGTRYRIIHSYRTPSRWEPRDTVSEAGSTYQQGPGQLTFGGGGLNSIGHAVWTGQSAARPTVYEVRYSEYSSSTGWTAPVNLTDTTGTRDRPSICNGLGNNIDLHVAWSDRRDGNNEIYYKYGSFQEVHDVGVSSIVTPVGDIDSGTTVTPGCSVYNYGTVNEPYYVVRMRIGSIYDNTAAIAGHTVGERRYVTFPPLTLTQRGTFAVSCSTMLQTDMADSNNARTAAINVQVHSVGVAAIAAPSGVIPPGLIAPTAQVFNSGTDRESLGVTFLINSLPPYAAILNLPGGLPFGDTTLAFPNWSAVPGNWTARCSIGLATEQHPEDDTVSQAFSVQGVIDVGVSAILVPAPTVETSAVVTPTIRVQNFGDGAMTFAAFFRISSPDTVVYSSTRTVTNLPAGASGVAAFDVWPKPHNIGTYSMRCSTWVALDEDPSNDTINGSFQVMATPNLPWIEKSSMPLMPSGKAVKDGGWCTFSPSDGIIYAGKGVKSGDFYSYSPARDSWAARAPIVPGREDRPPAKGATGVADNNATVYFIKGNNTCGFYRYYSVGDSWRQLDDVPLGITGKKVKGGDDVVLAAKGTQGSVYLLKGYKNEFYRYDIGLDSWITLPSAPQGTTTMKYDKGSWLAYDGASTIYCHKSKYNELFAFDITRDSWSTARLKGMPYIGRSGKSKKSKDGSQAAWYATSIYALKGNNTQEFWKYVAARDSWAELETIPSNGSGGKKKVKTGGDIVSPGTGGFYALKGNKTLEFWQYVGAGYLLAAAPSRDGIAAGPVALRSAVSITPNPLRSGTAVLRVGSVQPTPVSVAIYDASGRCVFRRAGVAGRYSGVPLDLRELRAGVYVARVATTGGTASAKLVID